MSGGFISFDQAMLDNKQSTPTQGVVIGKDVPPVSPETVTIPTERITGEAVTSQSDASSVATPFGGQSFETPAYRDSRDMPLQHSGGRSDDAQDADMIPPRRPSSGAKSSGKKKPKAETKPQSPVVQVRDFPRSLMAVARAEFPDATNNADALAAYVLAKSGRSNLDVPESVSELVQSWDGDKTLENMEKRVSALTGQMAVMLSLMQELELLMTYVTFDRLGYRQDMPTDVRSVDFLESGVTDLMSRVREQAKLLRKQEAIKAGRPIR